MSRASFFLFRIHQTVSGAITTQPVSLTLCVTYFMITDTHSADPYQMHAPKRSTIPCLPTPKHAHARCMGRQCIVKRFAITSAPPTKAFQNVQASGISRHCCHMTLHTRQRWRERKRYSRKQLRKNYAWQTEVATITGAGSRAWLFASANVGQMGKHYHVLCVVTVFPPNHGKVGRW